MSEARFTKGVWEVKAIEDDKEYIRIRGTSLGRSFKICNVSDLKNHHNTVAAWCKWEREESMANANLIAAAPKMYKMLEEIAISMECEHGVNTDEIFRLLATARGEII